MRSDPDHARYMLQGPSKSLADAERDILRILEKGTRGEVKTWAVLLGDGENAPYCGEVGLVRIDWEAKQASLSYELLLKFQGRGLMREAAACIVSHALNDLGIERLQIEADVRNERSLRVADALGFEREAILRGHAQYADGGLADDILLAWKAPKEPEE